MRPNFLKSIAWLLTAVLSLSPLHAFPDPAPDLGDMGRQAQEFGDQQIEAFNFPTLENGEFKLGGNTSLNINELFPGLKPENQAKVKDYFPGGNAPNIESLQGMHHSNEAMNAAGTKGLEALAADSQQDNPSVMGSAYQVLQDAAHRSRPSFENDPMLNSSKEIFSPENMDMFVKSFADCQAEEQFAQKSVKTHIPDYYHCHRLYKPKGGCTIHHTIEIATEPTDIVFLVDNSGSMDAVIADLRNNVRTFASLISQGSKGNLRIGGAAFRDGGSSGGFFRQHFRSPEYTWNNSPLTDNIEHFQNWINGVHTAGAETYPFDALSWAAEYYHWRENVHRIIVLIGNDDQGGDKWGAIQRLNSRGIRVYMFHNNPETKSIGTHLADYFSGPQLLKFAQFLTVVKDSWHPQPCINDAATILEGFCKGSYHPIPASDNECVNISGFIVCKGDSIYHKLGNPPLPNLHKLATRVEVSALNCNFNHGVGSCWIDPQGENQCISNNQDIKECDEYDKNPNCGFISSECVDGAKGRLGNCYVWKDKYDCGTDVLIPTWEKTTQYKCAGPIRCMGNDCIDINKTQSGDFARVAALLHAAQFMTQDMDCDDVTGQQNVHCRAFSGKEGECKIAVGGVQNCCKKPENISMNDYLSLILAVPKLDSAITTLSNGSSIGKAYRAIRSPIVGAWDKVKSPFTSSFESISNKLEPITKPFKQLYDKTIGKLKEQANKIMSNLLKKTGQNAATKQAAAGAAGKGAEAAAKEGTKEAAKEGANEVLKEGAKEAGKEAASATTSALTSLLGIAMTIYTIYSVSMLMIKLIWKCEQHEFEMNAKRVLKSCSYIGSYCKSKVLGVCVESREAYCCFNSPLSRIIQEQVRPQLGLSFGSAKNPECGGIPLEKIGQVDWNKVNLDEWLAILQQNGRLPSADSINIDSLTGSGSVFNVDGTRKNAQERTLKRLEGVNIDKIREKAVEEVIPQRPTEKKP